MSGKGTTSGSPQLPVHIKKLSKPTSHINSHNSYVSEHDGPNDKHHADVGDHASFYDAGPSHGIDGVSGEACDPLDQSPDWTMTDRLRLWRDDARAQHLYETAAFWGAKVYGLTSSPNDAFWLAQVYFLTGQFVRAEKILTGVRRLSRNANPSNDRDDPVSSLFDDFIPEETLLERGQDGGEHQTGESVNNLAPVRMTDYSTACRYLASQCMIRQGKWDAAMEMVGDENPFRLETSGRTDHRPGDNLPHSRKPGTGSESTDSQSTQAYNTRKYVERSNTKATMDGGIKFESSMCYIRGLVHLQHKSLDRAKECFLESLALDVKCYESFEALVGGNMLEPEEGEMFTVAVLSLGYLLTTC